MMDKLSEIIGYMGYSVSMALGVMTFFVFLFVLYSLVQLLRSFFVGKDSNE